MNVCIFGCGPSGLLAAEACVQQGHKVMILSDKVEPSALGGAQYIHEAIPDITRHDPDGHVTFHKVGTGVGYAKKVYGSADAPTSWAFFPEGEFPCWNMNEIYLSLWLKWREKIRKFIVGPANHSILSSASFRAKFPLIISSIPAYQLCQKHDEHSFKYVKVRFEPYDSGRDDQLGRNYIYYNGDEKDPWYRSSWIFGSGYFEYGQGQPEDAERRHLIEGIKPLDTDCDCHGHIVRVGRFGEWKKARLVHHAYQKTLDALEVMNAVHAM